MTFALDPNLPIRRSVRSVATDGLDDAISLLDDIVDGRMTAAIDVEHAVHTVRKRCKAMRGLARLVRPELGSEFRPFDRLVRDAAGQLSALRDAHATLSTFDALLAAQPERADPSLRAVREQQATRSDEATSSIDPEDERFQIARTLLADARQRAQRWQVGSGFDALGDGIEATYRAGRRSLRDVQREQTDDTLHGWRKSVKYLWYQTRLLHEASPSVLGPIVEQLDGLAEALGDDHDLSVLVELLDADPDRFGSPTAVAHTQALARAQQQTLRIAAIRAGSTIYVESAPAFRTRVEGYWNETVAHGPEGTIGGIAALADSTTTATATDDAPRPPIERERKFLIETIPHDLDLSDRIDIRQGYLVADDHASVRVRDAGDHGCTLTVKAGSGAVRTELEWSLDQEHFEAAWAHTAERRVVKTRHRIPLDTPAGAVMIELDIFKGDLTGLIYAEVEFATAEALDEFVPPDWFSHEVTDDGRYTNASLALHGRP